MRHKILAAVAAGALVVTGGSVIAASADTRNNSDAFYFCISPTNTVTHAYPLNGWHGNSCAAGESRYEVQAVPEVTPDPPVTDAPSGDLPTDPGEPTDAPSDPGGAGNPGQPTDPGAPTEQPGG